MVDTIMMNPNNHNSKYFYVNLLRQVVDVEVDGKNILDAKIIVDERHRRSALSVMGDVMVLESLLKFFQIFGL